MLKNMLVLFGILFTCMVSAKTMTKINIPLNGNAFIVQNYSSGTIVHTGQFDPIAYWASFQNTQQKFNSFTNTLELDQIESAALLIDFDYNLKIVGTLNIWTVGSNDPVHVPGITLEINYDPTAQKTSRRMDYYAYSNAYKSEFILESVTLTSQTLQGIALYDAVSKIVELNFGIEQTAYSLPVFSTVPAFHNTCVDNVTNELILSWTSIDFAEEYELEITFKDNYTDNINVPLPASAITYDFKENSTRIVTKQNYYRIPLVYERGYLLFRVRAVGMGGTNWNKRIPCSWSGPSTGNVGQSQNKYGPILSHVGDKMNWQLSTTYSDEGKRKDVVQYYDGLFMSRQTVTGVSQVKNMFTQNVLDNSKPNKYKLDEFEAKQISGKVPEVDEQDKSLPIPEVNVGLSPATGIAHFLFPVGCTFYGSEKIKEIIAQEIIYDFNGRPALQILPAPTGTHKITYIKKLNKNLAGNSYSWKDFDFFDGCLLTARPVSDVATGNALGAGVYYSPKNPNKLGYNAFIPDSKGYPFSRVQYTFDNTGRTYRQAGVGAVHTMDNLSVMPGHETKFYYAKPNQVELDRMFGNEVGYAIRYQKNMVIDPNGQVSVSYLNPEGKTIATALTGEKPDNLLALDNESNSEVTIHVDLLASNIPDSLEHSLTVNEQFVVASEAEYKFDYTVNGEKLSYSYCLNNNICLDCIYDIEIKLLSNDSECMNLFSNSGTFGDFVNPGNPNQLNMDLSCINSSKSFDTLITLQAGSYTLVKTLKVNKFAAEAYVNLVFKDTCQSVLDEFLDEEINNIDTTGCYESCSTCQEENTDSLEKCAELCPEPMNECERARYMMLKDVSPGGQYAQYDVTANGYSAANYPLSIFNPSNSLPHPNQQGPVIWHDILPQYPDLQSLILNWDDSAYPDLFISFHPESCMLDWCDNENYGADYDLQLGEAVTYQGVINSNLISASSNDPMYKQIFDNDPFFHNGPNINTGIDFLNFLSHPCGDTRTLDDFAKEAAYCQSLPATQAIISSMQNSTGGSASYVDPAIPDCVIPDGYTDPADPAFHAFGSDPATEDYEWQNLRNMYLTYKEKYLYESRKTYSINNGCFNGCIGVENFFFYHSFSFSVSVEGVNHFSPNDPCGITRFLYENKVKRFTNRYDAFSHTSTDNEIDLSGVNLYDPCATEENINLLQPQIGAIVNQYLCPPDSEIEDTSNLDSLSNCSSNSITQLLNAYLPALSNNPNVPITVSETDIPIRFRDIQGGTFINAPDPCLKFYYDQGFYHISAENCGTYSSIYCEFKIPAVLVNSIPKPIEEICCSETQFTTNADNYGYFNSEFIIKYTDGTSDTFPVVSKCDWFDSCSNQSSTVESNNCPIDEFTLMLNQYLPLVTNSSPFFVVGNHQVTTGLENLMYSMSGVQLLRIRLKYEITSHEFNITFDGADGRCNFNFPAETVNNLLKPLSGVCCGRISSEHEVRFTLQYTDGTSSEVAATVDCSLPVCPEEGTELEYDSCATKTPFTNELFSFLSILKTPGTPLSGLYNNNGLSQQIDHIMDPFAPVKYSMDQANCTLTFSATTAQPGDPVQPDGSISRRSTIRTTVDMQTRDQANLIARPKIPAPCYITFSDCMWMSSDATLISIKPYFPNGIADVITDEFIITYCKVTLPNNLPDTLTVIGNSGCFPVNNCDPPYFCTNDTIPVSPPNNYNGCVESKILTATYIAYSNYEKWIDSLKTDLLSKYYAKCMKAVETISYDYPDNQFHYTLYYYDQAGNLVRTVPPAGVHLIPPTLCAQIDSDRDAHIINGASGITAHTLVTNYSYNSLNQNRWQITPDAGRTDFWYDKLGRIVASQNAKQLLNNDYSYSWYDKLGRIVESGKIHLTGSLDANAVKNYGIWQNYLYSIPDRTEITYTKYDNSFGSTVSSKFGPDGQQNLRGRVASIIHFTDKNSQVSGNYKHATHYTYDVTGNVSIVIQDYPSTPIGTKAIAYNFDLLTGKVNEVRYEPELPDEFRHKYIYDDELRLTKVQTSTKGIVWETEAEYFYYKHGPLARTELGQLKVQGLDYIYTLQGWIKGVNGTTQDRTQDAGGDGIALKDPKQITTLINGQPVNTFVENDPNHNSTGSGYHSLHSPVAADAFGYVLGYYNDPGFPDYIPIDPAVNTTAQMDAATIGDVKPLYNGNISRMYTWLQGEDMGGLGMNYRYDQLNRIKIQQAFTIGNTGGQTLLGNDAYGMNLSYNPDGNIMSLDRNGRVTNPKMDKLNYHYYPGTNKLEYVNDAPGYSGNYPENGTVINGTVTDIDNQSNGNYTYDEIGNLIQDNSEGIDSIKWSLQNKITAIKKTDGTQINFAYDALGNRVYKKYSSGSTTLETYYVRDASGNILSTYEMKDDTLRWNEQNLYGSSRLGVWHPRIIINDITEGITDTIDWQNIKPLTSPAVEDSTIRGSKQYELTNHLGNVLATISDRRMQIPVADGTSGITADLITATDYYAFGMQMPGRNFSSSSYRFGFNGKENDNAVKGDGNQQDYGTRVYDSRIAKFLSIDPLAKFYSMLTPYQFASNKPINSIDIDGLESADVYHYHDSDGQYSGATEIKLRDKDENGKNGILVHQIYMTPDESIGNLHTSSYKENLSQQQYIPAIEYVGFNKKTEDMIQETIDNQFPVLKFVKESGNSLGNFIVKAAKSADYALEGERGFNNYVGAIGTTGKFLSTISPLGKKTPIIGQIGWVLSLSSDFMKTAADIDKMGLIQGLKNGAIRATGQIINKKIIGKLGGTGFTEQEDATKLLLKEGTSKIKEGLINESNENFHNHTNK